MYEKTIKTISKLIGTTLIIPLRDWFLNQKVTDLFCVIIAVALSVALMFLTEYIFLDLPIHSIKFRKLVMPISKFEGCWIQKLSFTQRPHSIAWIEYDFKSKKHKYWGYAFNEKGEKEANWYSEDLMYLNPFGFHFYGKGYINETSNNMPVENWGYLQFFSSEISNKEFDSGTGFSVDLGNLNSSSTITFERLTKAMIHDLIGLSVLKSQEDFKNFIIKYHNMHL